MASFATNQLLQTTVIPRDEAPVISMSMGFNRLPVDLAAASFLQR
jgi:hypothetical protein